MRRPEFKRLHWCARWALRLLVLVGAIALVRDTAYQGQDFAVFWGAGRALLEGHPIYDLVRDGAMVFKYPPWFVPFFVPFGFLDLSSAKWGWGLAQVISLIYVVFELRKYVVRPWMVYATLISFWGIWAVHTLDGQINLILLAVVLGLWKKRGGLVETAILGVLSAKVFTLFAALGRRSIRRFRVMIQALCIATLLSLPALWVEPGRSVTSLVSSWSAAAASGGELLSTGKIRGRDNQGLPALALRLANVPANRPAADFIAFGVVGALLFFLASVASRQMSEIESAALWLGLTAAVHPLAWFHLFVFAFPLVVVTLSRTWTSGSRLDRWLTVIGWILITVITRKTLGQTGAFLELLSIKSIGVLLCSVALYRSTRARVVAHAR